MVLGVDVVVVRTPFEDFTVRVQRGGARPEGEALELARWAATQIRMGIDMNEAGVAGAARALVRLVDGIGSGFGLDRSTPLNPFSPSGASFGGIAARVEEELLAGRLVVERRRVAALSEGRDPFELELPPLPPPRRESTTRTFEVRFIDEAGKAISGVDAEFTADGPQTRPTNAAGVALLEGVQSSSANVAILDPDALSKVLDPRWESFRPGKPPKESNTTEVIFTGSELGPFPLKAEQPNTVVIKPPLGKLFVELWDKTGRVRHANRAYRITGPQSFEGTTDEDGRLLHTDVFPGDYQLSLALDFFEEGDPDRTMDVVDSPIVVLAPGESEPQTRLLGVVPRCVLARLHMFFNTNKAFLLPTALPSMRKLRRLYEDNAPCELLVVGHADTRAGASVNDPLSLERAEATIAFLKDDVEGWFEFYGADLDAKKRWGNVEDHLMIIAMPGFVSKPTGEDPVKWYQRTRSLVVDGVAGKVTRRALIGEYMSLDGASLSEVVGEIDAVAHGCGENFPLDEDGEKLDSAPADQKRDPGDRRVELFFFDTEFGITPPPPGPRSKPGSPEYPLWRRRVTETVELRADDLDGPQVVFAEVASAHFRTDSAVVLPEGETPESGGDHQALTSVGVFAAALRFLEEEPNRRVLVAGHTDSEGAPQHNDELSLLRARVTLALLVGDRDTFKQLAHQRSKPADINQILSWVCRAFEDATFTCDPGKVTNVVRANDVKRFQTEFNDNKSALSSTAADLVVDGEVGENTWGAFFDCYEHALELELGETPAGLAALRAKLTFVDDARRALGFGERFPIEELGVDDFESQANRRAEILFFEPGEEPDLVHAQEDAETSEIYLPGFYERTPLDVFTSARAADRATGIRLPTRFSPKKSFPKPSLIPGLQAALELLEARPEARLVIVGHTDPVGTDADNYRLSLERAEAVRAWLTNDHTFFAKQFVRTTENAWDFEEVQWMLHAIPVAGVPCYVGQADGFAGGLTSDALGRFQLATNDLAVSYAADQETLDALIDRYLGLLGDTLDPARIDIVGGGSWCPPQPFLGGSAPAADPLLRDQRRVELFVFPVAPRPAPDRFPTARALPVVYQRWCDQTGEEISAATPPFFIQAHDSNAGVLSGATIQLAEVLDDQNTAALGSVTTDGLGVATVSAPPGTYFAQVQATAGVALLTSFELEPDTSCGASLFFSVAGGLDDQPPALQLGDE